MRWPVFLIALLVAAGGLDFVSEPRLILRLEWQGPPTTGQLFWSESTQEFVEARSTRFAVKPGSQTIVVNVPSRVRWLRFDPAEDEGKLRLFGAKFSFSYLPLDFSEFDAPAAFAAWSPDQGHHLRSTPLGSGPLEYDSVGNDPYLTSPPLYGVALWRWLQILLLSVVIATGLTAATTRLPAGRRKWIARGAAAAAMVGLAAFGVSRLWRETRWFDADSRDVGVAGYELSFYDVFGRPISTRKGPLAMVIDPFTVYRNYPNQDSAKFKIDSHGFRHSGPGKHGAEVAFVLGGSTTFGMAAPSDEDTFVYRMSKSDPRIHYVNAAVVGFQSGQELALMVHHLDAFAPKLYLAVDGWNDVQQNLNDPHGDDLGFNHSTFDLVQDHLFRLASLQASGLPGPKPPVSIHGESERFEDKLIRRYLDNVERMHGFARSQGSVFALAIQPTLALKTNLSPFEKQRSAPWRDSKPTKRAVSVYRRLARETLALCNRRGIPCIDLNSDPEFLSTSETFFADDCHLSPQGNRWAAARLGEFVTSGRLRKIK